VNCIQNNTYRSVNVMWYRLVWKRCTYMRVGLL